MLDRIDRISNSRFDIEVNTFLMMQESSPLRGAEAPPTTEDVVNFTVNFSQSASTAAESPTWPRPKKPSSAREMKSPRQKGRVGDVSATPAVVEQPMKARKSLSLRKRDTASDSGRARVESCELNLKRRGAQPTADPSPAKRGTAGLAAAPVPEGTGKMRVRRGPSMNHA